MKQQRFGSGGPLVSAIGQGTWYIDRGDRTAVTAVAMTCRWYRFRHEPHIDTAEMYGDAEPVVAEAIAGRRDEVFLVSKVLPGNASRRGTVTACERSLARLKTDRLDCYLLHWRGQVPLSETVAAFDELVRAGKILSWGVSNFDTDDLTSIQKVAGHGRIACNQVLYHLHERAIEHAVDSLVRGAWRRRGGLLAVRATIDFPRSAQRSGAGSARPIARGPSTPRCARLR